MAARPRRLASDSSRGPCVRAGVAVLVAAGGGRGLRPRPPPPPGKAQRIVSLVPAVTEMLFAIGAGPQVVGVSSYDHFPPEVEALPKVGALLDPDTERILVAAARPGRRLRLADRDRSALQEGRHPDVQLSPRRRGRHPGDARHHHRARRRHRPRRPGPRGGHAHRRPGSTRCARASRGSTRPRTLLVMGRQPGTLQGIYAAGGVGFLHEMLDDRRRRRTFSTTSSGSRSSRPAKPCWRGRRTCCSNFAHERPRATIRPATWPSGTRWRRSPPSATDACISVVGDFVVVAGPRLAEGAEAIARVLHPEAFK